MSFLHSVSSAIFRAARSGQSPTSWLSGVELSAKRDNVIGERWRYSISLFSPMTRPLHCKILNGCILQTPQVPHVRAVEEQAGRNCRGLSLAKFSFSSSHYQGMQVMAFVHGHRSSWHSHDMVEDLQRLKWASVEGYMPLHVDYFQPYGMYFDTHLADPSKHLRSQLATGEAAQNVTAYDPGQVDSPVSTNFGFVWHFKKYHGLFLLQPLQCPESVLLHRIWRLVDMA